MHRLRTREAFHAAGHGSGRRPLSEMQRRLLSDGLAHYAAHSTQRSSACWITNFVASELLPLQICGDFGELCEGGLEVFNDFGGDDVGIGKIGAAFEAFVFESDDVEIECLMNPASILHSNDIVTGSLLPNEDRIDRLQSIVFSPSARSLQL
jgi:hypothetical protein